MKKQYNKPQIMIVEAKPVVMQSGSETLNLNNSKGKSGTVLSREIEWDTWDDE